MMASADLMATVTNSVKPKAKKVAPVTLRRRALPGQCTCTCPGGHPCCLGDVVEHELCICEQPDCFCHSRERYDMDRKPTRSQGG